MKDATINPEKGNVVPFRKGGVKGRKRSFASLNT